MTVLLWIADDAHVEYREGLEGLIEIEFQVRKDASDAVRGARCDRFDAFLISAPAPEDELRWMIGELARVGRLPALIWLEEALPAPIKDMLEAGAHPFTTIADLEPDSVRTALDRLGEAGRPVLTKDPQPLTWEETLVGEGASMRQIRQLIRLVAPRTSTVLITGETGTGKEVVAKALHQASARSHRPMVAVNCAALPATLLESELFGHVKGAFTGAMETRIGRFEKANGGTIFLDEIGDMPLDLQAKLLRVLQEREIQRVGSSDSVSVDVRVIVATNRDLAREVQEGRFRSDLYFRLSVIPMRIPSLRDRIEDVPLLVEHFLDKICTREKLERRFVDSTVIEHLLDRPWPGNVRELEHAVERAVALSGERLVLDATDFASVDELVLPELAGGSVLDVPESGIQLDEVLGRMERSLLQRALRRSNGNKARAAELLGLKRTTFVHRAKAAEVCAC